MTRKLTISLPDDVAERLDREKNVSAFIAESVRQRMTAEQTRRVLSQLGFDLSSDGMAATAMAYDDAMTGVTPDLRARAAALVSEARQGRPAA